MYQKVKNKHFYLDNQIELCQGHLVGHAGVSPDTKRRINTECKAKVVDAVWGTKFILFLSLSAILH